MSKRGKGKLTDAEVIEMREEQERLKAHSRAIADKAAKVEQKIVEEMERRGTKAIEHGGKRVTYVQQEVVVYGMDAIYGQLSVSQRKKVTKPVIDKGLLLAAVQKGDVPAKIVEANTTINYNKPFTRISNV